MVVQVRSDSLRLIRQLDHSLACGRMALAWKGTGPRPDSVPFEVAAGIGLHDLAWGPADREPVLDSSTGLPVSFLTIDDGERTRMFRAGLDREEAVDPAAALLASLHYARFSEQHHDTAFVEHERARRRRLLARRATDRDEVTWERHADLLRHLDDLSLYVCLAGPDSAEQPDWLSAERVGTAPGGAVGRLEWNGPSRLALDPFPFRQTIRLEIPCRDLPRRGYESDAELKEAWRAAVPRAHEVTLAPAR